MLMEGSWDISLKSFSHGDPAGLYQVTESRLGNCEVGPISPFFSQGCFLAGLCFPDP